MIGKIISHYKIIDKLGEGGMGQVFLADDTSLDRKVALKFLSEDLQQDPTARKRFQREAKSVAALDHPYICNIFEVGEENDTAFIAMEYVQGQTLKEELSEGPLPFKEAIKAAAEIAEALEKAHQEGIIHRDLKPANIMVTPEGHVKVMDFGLAKQVQTPERDGGEDLSASMTQEGLTPGTLAYMSPEQIRGEPLDTRSDLFSFGIIFYEMLTGVHPFRKKIQVDTAAAILRDDLPPITKYLSKAPELLQRILENILVKEPEQRYHPTGELKMDLANLLEGLYASEKKRLRILVPAVFVLLSIIAAGFFIIKSNASLTSAPQYTARDFLSTLGTRELQVSWSPNGDMIAYVSDEDKSEWGYDIWICNADGTNHRNLTKNFPHALYPAWSPDGQEIVFRSERDGPGIYMMDIWGNNIRKITDTNRYGDYVAWSERLNLLVYTDRDSNFVPNVYTVSPTGENTICRTFDNPGEGEGGEISPNGEFLCFTQNNLYKDDVLIYLLNLNSGKLDTLSKRGFHPKWHPAGQHLFILSVTEGSMGGDLWIATINPRTGKERGRPLKVTTGINIMNYSFDPGGENLVITRDMNSSNISIFPSSTPLQMDLQSRQQLTTGNFRDSSPRWMPNGEQLVFSSNRRGNWDIWRVSLLNRRPEPLTTADTDESFPIVSPDGQWIIYNSRKELKDKEESRSYEPYIMRSDGSNQRPLSSEHFNQFASARATDWSHNGEKISVIFRNFDGSSGIAIATIDLTNGSATEVSILTRDGLASSPFSAFWSPDDTFIAFEMISTGVWVLSVDGNKSHRIVIEGIQHLGGWSPISSSLYYSGSYSNEFGVCRLPMNADGYPGGEPVMWSRIELPDGGTMSNRFDFHLDGGIATSFQYSQQDLWLLEFSEK